MTDGPKNLVPVRAEFLLYAGPEGAMPVRVLFTKPQLPTIPVGPTQTGMRNARASGVAAAA